MRGGLIVAGRIAGLAGALFLSVFVADVFTPDTPFLLNLLGLLVHLLPSAVLIALVGVSMRWPLVGGILLLFAALMPFVLLSNTVWTNALLAALPGLAGLLLVTGALRGKKE